MKAIGGECINNFYKSERFDDKLLIWDSNFVYHVAAWILFVPMWVIVMYIFNVIFESQSTPFNLYETTMLIMANRIIPLFSIILILYWTLFYTTILRIQIDHGSDVIIWEKISMIDVVVVHRKLSDLQAILQPRQRVFFREPAKLVFLDGALPMEIRKPLRLHKNSLPQDIADKADIPIVIK